MSWNQWHSSQSSWPSWGQDWSSHGGWKAPTTTPRKPSKQHVEDSPQGSAQSSLGLPASFKSTKKFYDTPKIFNMSFRRKIQPGAWAIKHGLACWNVEDIKLHELSWQGWQNYNLRALAQGRYVSIYFTTSIKEATFVSYFLQHLREQKLDLDQIAECFFADSGIQVSSETPEHFKKTFRIKELEQFVVKPFQPHQAQELADAQDRIKDLERQLAQQRKRTHTEAKIGPKPLSNSQSSQPSQSDGTGSDSKRVRRPFKSGRSQANMGKGKNKSKPSSKGSSPQEDPGTLTEKAFHPAFTPSKVLGSNAPPTASPRVIIKWIAKPRLTEQLKAQLQQSAKWQLPH